ncbi:MAG: molybdate ABC transporter substrate-binding protein [Bryobacterales bacterium]|nr:molybdate ABC transporter substrate-binding protein [Bryobacterales bacterium]
MSSLLSCSLASSLLPAGDLVIATASDLAPVQANLASSFHRLTGIDAKFVTGASGMLARQIAGGAPYDVFLSANKLYVDDLVRSGDLIADSVAIYAKGRIGLWSLAGTVKQLEDLRRPEVKHIAIANPQHAPYGAAARQALQRAGLWSAVKDKIVYGENVRQALQYAESGNADAVITSWSLLEGRGTLLPESLHDPIRRLWNPRRSNRRQEARAFLRSGPEAWKYLADLLAAGTRDFTIEILGLLDA